MKRAIEAEHNLDEILDVMKADTKRQRACICGHDSADHLSGYTCQQKCDCLEYKQVETLSVPDLMTVYLEVRRGNKRLSVSRQISMLEWRRLLDNGYHGLYEAALNGMRVELEPYVRFLAV